ncbi:MAG: biopolymer transporter ExbD [bacterium]
MGWTVHGFRHYRPQNQLNKGLVATAPWISVTLLIVMYLYLLAPNVLQPGVAVQLPEAPFTDGRHYGHNIAVLSLPMAGRTDRDEIFFFDDQRFLGRDPEEMNSLRSTLMTAWTQKPNLPLVIEADRMVRHETIVTLFDMASEAGFREVNLATRPSPR